jgi:hypothetical protein
MPFTYRDVLLWGHSLADYNKMFLLNEHDRKSKLLDCCGGPSSFNAELTAQGGQVISCDPLFALTFDKMKRRINEVFAEMLVGVKYFSDRFMWTEVLTPEELADIRSKNMEIFLQDFKVGVKNRRYLSCSLPKLNFDHEQFDLAVCSHYLFAHSPDQSEDFHIKAIASLCKVAKEVRIFPLLDSEGEIPALVGPVIHALQQMDHGVEIVAVPYEFQKKGNAMLRVWAQTCKV